MMRKLLYSFLFFISSKSLSKRLCKPSLGLLCVGMFFWVNFANAQVTTSTWALTGNANAVVTGNVSASPIAIGSGLNSLSFTTNGATTGSWSDDASSLRGTEYYEFKVTPATGYTLNVTNINFQHSVSSGNWQVQAYYSTDNFATSTQISNAFSSNSSTPTNRNTAISIPAITTSITIRIYGWESDGSGRSLRIRNFAVTGNTCPPAPTTTNAEICQGGSGALSATLSGATTTSTTFSGSWDASVDLTANMPVGGMVIGGPCDFNSSVKRNYTAVNFTVSQTGSYTFKMTDDTAFDGMAYIYTGAFTPGSCGSGTWIVGADDDVQADREPRLVANLTVGTVYTLISTTWANNTGTYSGNYTWTVTPPSSGQLTLSTVNWYTTPAGGNPIWNSSVFNPVGVTGSGISSTPAPGPYTFYASSGGASCSRTAATFTVNATPTLTGVTQSASVCAGSVATINLTGLVANSTSTISYTINGIAQPNATSVVATGGGEANFTTSALTVANNGQTLQITGITTSSNCSQSFNRNTTLSVNARPTAGLTSSDSDNIFCVGTSVTFTASGGTSYVFKVGSTTVQSGTNSTYTTSSLTNGQVVTVDVTNASGCTATSAGITNTVNPVHTISAGANRSVCQNSTMTPIVLTLGGGATDAVVTGLPSGVTSSVTGNTLTISGNPTAIGVFNYNITTTGNSCTIATTTGTITVGIGNNIITYNNGNSNLVCVAVDENQTAIFTAPAGTYFNTVSFASYGSPTGSCGAFQINYVCHSTVKSQSYTESSLLGNTGTINVVANNENFDDPCVSTFKAYKAVARYSEPICAGTIPGQISGSAPTGGGAYAYLWEISTTSSTSGFSAAPGTNNTQNYIPTVQVTRDTWFRRTVTSGGTCPNVSAVVLIKVNPSPTLTGASQSASVCSGSAATINLTGLLAGSTSTISYSINSVAQTPITSLVATSGGTASFTTPVLTEVNNGQILQITGVTTTSSTPNCSLSFSTNVTLAVNPTPTLTGASQPLSVCTGSAATVNLTGLLTGSTSTISYSINGVAQIPITSVVATAGGTASFTTPALTYENNGQTLRITQITTTSSTPNCSSAFTSDVTLSINEAPITPTITKNHDAACNTLGSITLTGLSGNWTVNQTGATTLPKSYPGPGASLAIQDLAADTYSFTVTDNTTGCTSSPATVTITDTSSNTEWDATGWTNGEPDGSKSVTISYVTASHQPFTIAKPNIQACSLTITATSDVIIPDGVTLTITNKVTSNGKLVFESGSSLLQTTNVKNDGDIVYKRTTKINRFDLTYWSSPVRGEPDTFKMKDLSSETLFDKFFTYSPTGGWATSMYGMAEMEPGIGYSIRGPQSFESQTAADFTGEFKGRPNNGDITVPSVVPDKWFLLGNPYPSAIDVDALWDANKDVLGALYFWTHVAPPTKAPGDNTYRYASNDYAVYTASGGTVVGGTKAFDGFIAAGQGFFVRPKTTEIHFNNDMRRGSSVNGTFYKVANKSKSIERNRIWLNMVNNEGAFKQILVGYIEGATNNVDFNYDAPTISGNSYLDFYSLNETKKLTIQGRALPFENTDLVPLGYKTTVAGDFTIGIDHGDGFFGKQEVYLEDKTTGKTINLRNENYTFSTLIGTFTERFVLRYTGKTLGTDDLENLENSVLVSVKNKTVSITCSKETIKDVTIFNVGGQLVYSKNKVNSSELQITNLHSSDQVLLVKVTLENGSTVTKKVIFSNL
jgi:hypothetical protein